MIQNNSLKLPVEEFTTPNPDYVGPNDNIERIIQLMLNGGYRHIVVVQKGKAVGIVSDRDIHQALEENNNDKVLLAKDIMSDNLYRAKSTTNIDEVVFNMSDKKIGSAIIEDEEGGIVGIFTRADALNALVEIIRGEANYETFPKAVEG